MATLGSDLLKMSDFFSRAILNLRYVPFVSDLLSKGVSFRSVVSFQPNFKFKLVIYIYIYISQVNIVAHGLLFNKAMIQIHKQEQLNKIRAKKKQHGTSTKCHTILE